jgi:hypothetical protein
MATTTPNFGWPVPTSTDLVKDGATAIEALGDGIDTSLVDLKGGTTGQVLSKTTSADMDFTWVTSDDANAIQNAIVNAKGDIIGASANDTPAITSVGANGEMLVADSSTSTGLDWKTATEQYPWTTWTPTFSNFTAGNATITARYQQIGKTVTFSLRVILGSTSSVTGAVGFSLPATNANSDIYVNGAIYDTGTQNFASTGILFSGSCFIRLLPANGTYTGIDAISATTPMTWTTGDIFFSNGSYEVA